jgi:hypothetical protein
VSLEADRQELAELEHEWMSAMSSGTRH